MRWLWASSQYLTDHDRRIVPIGEHRVLVSVGHVHAFQGHDLRHVAHPVRAAQFVDLTDAYAPRQGRGSPTRTDEVLRQYVRVEISGQKVCKYFVCMTTMFSISR